ncbi:hypothetical protein N2152v2_000480 [Parachlorella kessleri]
MILVTGPAAAVQVEDMLLQGAAGSALLAANFSQVELSRVGLQHNRGMRGGALAVSGGSKRQLTPAKDSDASEHVRPGPQPTLQRQAPIGDSAQSAAAGAGADILIEEGGGGDNESTAEAWFDLLPRPGETRISGGGVKPLKELGALTGAGAVPQQWWQLAQEGGSGGGDGLQVQQAHERTGRRWGRGLQQQGVVVTNEQQLGLALSDAEPFITLISHMVLGGDLGGPQSLLPSITRSIQITGDCPVPYGGKCVIDGNLAGRIFFADNKSFLPGVVVRLVNLRLQRGSAMQGAAFLNTGAMQVEFVNCEFVGNTAQQGGGAVSLVEGASGDFETVTFQNNKAGLGTGGAVLLTGNAYFAYSVFDGNSATNGGAVGVGGSSTGIGFEGCTFQNNSASIFGQDVYLESWVATTVYMSPFPTPADVWPTTAVQSMAYMPRSPPPAAVTSPPPSPPLPPRPPPPSPPSPPNPSQWIYSEDQLWDALSFQNATITLAAHIQLAKGGRWFAGAPPTITGEVSITGQCQGFGATCIIDMEGAPNPLLLAGPGSILRASGVRIINGGTTGDGAAVQLTAPLRAQFEGCDFLGNEAANGGAVVVRGGTDVTFSNCQFGINQADSDGGAVKLTGSSVAFKECTFFQNQAANGGAVALGPLSMAFFLDTNFTSNQATKWGPDIFVASPVGSALYFNQWPPPAAIFPAQAETSWYFAPPPAPPSPPSPPPAPPRPPSPPPGPRTPLRVKSPPPSPPPPPPSPPPPPPGPPLDQLVKKTPLMWGPMIMAGFGALTLAMLCLLACCHRRVLPRVDDPEEEAALQRDLMVHHDHSSDLEDEDSPAGGGTEFQGIQVVQDTSPQSMHGGSARIRRRTGGTPHLAGSLGAAGGSGAGALALLHPVLEQQQQP